MNKQYAQDIYQNFLNPTGQYDIDAIECEFDCEVKFNTYVYRGENVFVSEIDLHSNFIVINSCDDSPIFPDEMDSKQLSVEDFIANCLN